MRGWARNAERTRPRVQYGGSVGLMSVGQGLIELEFGDRLRIRGIESGGLIEPEVGLGWGRADEWEYLIDAGNEGGPSRGSTAAWGSSVRRTRDGLSVAMPLAGTDGLYWPRMLSPAVLGCRRSRGEMRTTSDTTRT